MAEEDRKNWKELCSAAVETTDPHELLKIVHELNNVLKREEQIRRAFREEGRINKAAEEVEG
jgi:hypothetical protein